MAKSEAGAFFATFAKGVTALLGRPWALFHMFNVHYRALILPFDLAKNISGMAKGPRRTTMNCHNNVGFT